MFRHAIGSFVSQARGGGASGGGGSGVLPTQAVMFRPEVAGWLWRTPHPTLAGMLPLGLSSERTASLPCRTGGPSSRFDAVPHAQTPSAPAHSPTPRGSKTSSALFGRAASTRGDRVRCSTGAGPAGRIGGSPVGQVRLQGEFGEQDHVFALPRDVAEGFPRQRRHRRPPVATETMITEQPARCNRACPSRGCSAVC